MPDPKVTRKITFADEALTDKDKALIAKRVRAKEQAPSTRNQSYSYQFFQKQLDTLGNPYDVTHIPISVCKQMQRDPMLAFGLHFLNTPVTNAKWHIKCERADIAAFIDGALRPILARYIQQRSQSLSFGFAPIVKRFQLEQPNWKYVDPLKSDDEIKVWDEGNVQAVTWKPFTVLPSDPSICEPRFKLSDGSFNGIKYQGGATLIPFNAINNSEDGSKEIDLQHALWITNEKDSVNGSLWGFPRIGYAYRYWWSYWFRWALYDRFFERKADPPYEVYYPTGGAGDYTDGEEADPQSLKEIALALGDSARSGGTLAMPGDTVAGYDDRPTSVREWQIKEVEVRGDMSHFVETFEYLDVMKLRSIWISEQAIIEGSKGTGSKNVASEELSQHKENSGALAAEIDFEINNWIIPDLLAANYPEFDGTCEKVTTGFTEADQKTMQEALQWIGQSDADALRNLDIRELLGRLGMPVVSHSEIRRQEKEAQKALEESTPPVVEPDDEGAAAVNEFGQYVQNNGKIVLASTIDDANFVTRLPQAKQYEDEVVLKNGAVLRSKWNNALADIYEDFARFVSKQDFSETNLAEDEDVEKAVNKLLSEWEYSRKKTDTLLSDSQKAIRNIIKRAGTRELEQSGLETDWTPTTDAVAEFLGERGAQYVKSVDETVKAELRSFLSDAVSRDLTASEIASEVRSHFADFPGWKADRLARTEMRIAYNFATLEAGQQKGVKIVQAKDAQHGPSDEHCEDRSGKFYPIKEAYNEDEHPNGTLGWELVPGRENLSIQYVEEMPEDHGQSIAYFDETNDTIYLAQDIPKETEQIYLLQLGEVLKK